MARRSKEPVRIVYDPSDLRLSRDVEDVPARRTPMPRVVVDFASVPPWNMRRLPSGTRNKAPESFFGDRDDIAKLVQLHSFIVYTYDYDSNRELLQLQASCILLSFDPSMDRTRTKETP